MPTPQVTLIWNQPHISPPKRNPGLAKKIDERNQIKEQAERVRKTHGTFIETERKGKNQTSQRPLDKVPTHTPRGLPGPPKEKPGGALSHEDQTRSVGKPHKEEGDSAIPSSQKQAPMDRGLSSPECKEVVVDTSQVVVGTSQKGEEAVGCQPIRP